MPGVPVTWGSLAEPNLRHTVISYECSHGLSEVIDRKSEVVQDGGCLGASILKIKGLGMLVTPR